MLHTAKAGKVHTLYAGLFVCPVPGVPGVPLGLLLRGWGSSVCVFPEWEKVESGVITVVSSLLCTQEQPTLSCKSEWGSQIHASPQDIHMPGRKGEAETRKGRTGFGPE